MEEKSRLVKRRIYTTLIVSVIIGASLTVWMACSKSSLRRSPLEWFGVFVA